jgi:cyclophilin family peptidyl-prolyl cis-trans isomerase/HEAT repeat protein
MRILWTMVLLVVIGCPRTGHMVPPDEIPVAEDPAPEIALLEIARRENARDAASEVVPLLHHSDPVVVAAAVRALGRMGRPEALGPLTWRLRDASPQVREAAAVALSSSRTWDVDDEPARLLLEDEIGAALSSALEDENDLAVACAIARAMGAGAGADVWDELEALVLEGTDDERVAALEGMAMLGRRGIATPISGELLDPLLPALVVADPEVQWWSAHLLLRCPLADDPDVKRRAHEALVLASAADDPAVRAVVARAVAAVGHEDAVAVLAGMVEAAPAVEVRVAVARAATALQGQDRAGAVELLYALAADPEPGARELAVAGLGAVGDPAAADAVVPLLTDPDVGVRVAAVGALGSLGLPDAVELLATLADDPSTFVSAARASALAGLDAPEALEPLLATLDDEPLVRLTALEAMASREHPEARALLLAALGGDIPAEAVVAVDALSAAAADDEAIVASFLEAYDRWPGFEGAEVRLFILRAVIEADAAPQGWLDAALLDDDEFVRRAAASAIRSTGRNVVARAEPLPELSDPLHGVGQVTTARITTNRGAVEVELYPDVAPATVASFASLAEAGFHDGLTFHRVVPGFVVQTGDPDGTGWGGPGYRVRSEFSDIPYEPGTLGMARGLETDTEGSQWFITHDRQPHLTGSYTVFGRVVQGMEVVHAIRQGDTVESVEIVRQADGAGE